jgi:peptidoglycan-N-acetylglucosamine deacetylase
MREGRVAASLLCTTLAVVVALPFAWADPTPRVARVIASAVIARTPAPARPSRGARDLGHGQLIEGRCPPSMPRCIAFTFDDGPECRYTPRVLDALDARGIKATFFVVGHRLDGDDAYHTANRAVLRDTLRRGHLIGNHTYHHVELDHLREAALSDEIDRTEALIRRATGQRAWLLRAPFGALLRQRTVDAVFSRGYTPVFWELDTRDWATPSVDAVVEGFRAALAESPRGGVVLIHDTHWWSVAALPRILAVIDRRNASLVAAGEAPYRFINLDALYQPLGTETPRGMPLPRRHHHRDQPSETPSTARQP